MRSALNALRAATKKAAENYFMHEPHLILPATFFNGTVRDVLHRYRAAVQSCGVENFQVRSKLRQLEDKVTFTLTMPAHCGYKQCVVRVSSIVNTPQLRKEALRLLCMEIYALHKWAAFVYWK